MKSSPTLSVTWSLLALGLLCCGSGARPARAQESLGGQAAKVRSTSKAILGSKREELLKRYGKPTAICVFAGSLPNKLHLPEGVPQLSSKAMPKWAQSASFSLEGRQGSMVWLYKRGNRVASYLIDPLQYVEAASIAIDGKATAAEKEEFEVSALASTSLGEASTDVLNRLGFPREIRSTAPGITEFVYLAKTRPKGYEDVFATVFTIRDNQVVRVYSFSYLPQSSEQAPSDRLPSDPSKSGRYFLLKPA